MRGNLDGEWACDVLLRSIPARAGEPWQCVGNCGHAGVYPRACGGTDADNPLDNDDLGLSPRVRGNHNQNANAKSRHGSIPARAGEPYPVIIPIMVDGVYPRACGGTQASTHNAEATKGLSPRVRGNPMHRRRHSLATRSIPARAGEPTGRLLDRLSATVYPRACGGTTTIQAVPVTHTGLSPRVRGNRLSPCPSMAFVRSIPARAGEPRSSVTSSPLESVYPRACGGTQGTAEG